MIFVTVALGKPSTILPPGGASAIAVPQGALAFSHPLWRNLGHCLPPHWRKAGKEQAAGLSAPFPPMETRMWRTPQVSADCVWETRK